MDVVRDAISGWGPLCWELGTQPTVGCWAGVSLGIRNRCPFGHSRRKGIVVRMGGAKYTSLGARLLWNMAAFSPNTSSTGWVPLHATAFCWNTPSNNTSLVFASPLTSPSHGPLYTPNYSVWTWLALGVAAPESHGHIGLMSCDSARKHGCLGLPFGRGCGPGSVFDTECKSPSESTSVGLMGSLEA